MGGKKKKKGGGVSPNPKPPDIQAEKSSPEIWVSPVVSSRFVTKMNEREEVGDGKAGTLDNKEIEKEDSINVSLESETVGSKVNEGHSIGKNRASINTPPNSNVINENIPASE